MRFASFRGYLVAARETLMAGRRLRGPAARRTRSALGHAVAFSTWKSLTREQERADADVVMVLCALVAPA